MFQLRFPNWKAFSHIVGILALGSPALARADEMPAMPKPPSSLEGIVGNWKGGGTLTMGKDSAKLEATWSCHAISAQFGVACTFHVKGVPGVPVYEETDLFGFEPNSNAYHWYAVTNAGETHDHVAKPPQSKSFQFVYTGTQEGKPLREVIDLDFSKDTKRVTGRAETFIAGESVSVMQVELHK